jgi:hypothetical protein
LETYGGTATSNYQTLMNKFLQLHVKYSLFGLVVLVLSCNSEKKIIGIYGQHAGTGVSDLSLFKDKTFCLRTMDEGPLFYSEGDWKKERNYLILHFFQEKRNKQYSSTVEKQTNIDSIIIKATSDKEVLPYAHIVCVTKNATNSFQTGMDGTVHLKKTPLDSIYVYFVGKETAAYKVKKETSNNFIFNLAYAKGQYDNKRKSFYPNNTLKLLIVDDKLFTDDAFKDTANWNNWYGINHFEKIKNNDR